MLPVAGIFSRRRKFKQADRRRASCRTPRWRSFRPSIDPLEARNLLATFTVTNLDDSGAGSLREAITDANANAGADLIRFARDVEGTIALTGQLVVTDDVTIDGPGADKLTISGGGADRVFAILPSDLAGNPFVTPTLAQVATSPSVVIQKLAIKDGLATNAPGFDPADPTNPGFAFGGGLYNLGGSVHLERVLMADNAAVNFLAAGGAIANEFGGTLTVTRSEFDNNTTGGGLIAVGGAITSDLGPVADGGTTGQPNVTIDRSTFTGNSAAPLAGYIDGVAFSGLGVGGAILGVTGSTQITLSHFEGNSVAGGSGTAPGATAGGPAFGGAVYSGNASPFGIAQSSLEISRSTFIGNTASGGPGGAPGIPGGVASGGAIVVNNGSEAELTRNTFLQNEALGGVGGMDAAGGIATGGGVAGFGGADLTLERNQFTGNTADGGAGSGTGDGAAGRGGGLGLDSVGLAGVFPGTATATVLHDRYLGNVAAGGIGGGIYNEGDLTLRYTQLTDNRAVGETDAVIDFVPGYLFQGSALGGGLSNIGTIDVDRGFFEGNQAIGADGATGPNILLAMPPGSAAPTYPGLAVGGGLHNIQDATVTGSRFVENEALAGNGNSGSFAGVANGGGVYSDGSLVLTRGFLHGNRSVGGDNNSGDIGAGSGAGGGLTSGTVTALAPGGGSASLVVDRSTIRSNEAAGGGGNTGLFPVPTAHLPAGGLGGGILVYQGAAQVSNSLITENRAVGGEGGNGVGGGILFWGFTGPVDAELSGSIVTRNSAVGGDGADGLGGGIAAGSLDSLFGGPVTLTVHRSRISSNDAQGGGSGGDGLGGGIFNGSDGLLDLPASAISRNRALGGPGGVGVGGGLYNLGAVDDALALIFANFASTSDDDCFGC